jgi:antitoxin ParD1/3/4
MEPQPLRVITQFFHKWLHELLMIALGAIPATMLLLILLAFSRGARGSQLLVAVGAALGTVGLWLATFQDPRRKGSRPLWTGAMLLCGVVAATPFVGPLILAATTDFGYLSTGGGWLSAWMFLGPVLCAAYFCGGRVVSRTAFPVNSNVTERALPTHRHHWHTMPMPTRNVVLTDYQAELVERLVSSGRYQNASEVLREGLRLVEQQEEEDKARLKALREAAQIGIDAIEQGRYRTFRSSAEISKYVRARAEKVIAGTKKRSR